MSTNGQSLLDRVVETLSTTGKSEGSEKSILHQAAHSFERRPVRAEATIPTGFDPQAAALFEAVVEAAFLVANADGDFDDAERRTFETVVAQACRNEVQRGKVAALVSDLCDQLEEDGIDRRIEMIAAVVDDDEHRREVLRIAALMAYVSDGVHESERDVLGRLAVSFRLEASAVGEALQQAEVALGRG